MNRIRSFILDNFTKSYLLIFMPFLLIVSLIFIIQISVLSSKVNLSASELIKLFTLFLPEIFFYTIPLSLIAAFINTFAKLSEENELIALFALGHKTYKNFLYLLPVITLFSVLLLTMSLLMLPQSKQKLKQFKNHKIAEANLNVMPNKLSQNFGHYHIFVGKKNGNNYENLVLFNNSGTKKYQFFVAKKGSIENNNSIFTLSLIDGIGESSDKDKIQSLRYKTMKIYQYPNAEYIKVVGNADYWKTALENKSRRKELLFYIFISISPLLSFGIALSLAIFNPRYQKNYSSMIIFVVGLIIYMPAIILKKTGNIYLFATFVALLLAMNIILVRKKILKRY